MKATIRRERLRSMLAGTRCVLPASVHDPLSARLAESLEFEAAMFAGSVASLAILGAPDIGLVTLTEFAEQARRICRATSLPLLVDADHGYGNALNVIRTVEELEGAGVAGLTIEDTELPQSFGTTTPQLVSIAEGAGKIRAALFARDDAALVIVGRTAAAGISGIDDAIARCLAYQGAGVDGLFLTGIESFGDLERVCAAVEIPVLLGALAPDLRDLDYLGSLGVRLALQGHWPIKAAVTAICETYEAMRGQAAYSGSRNPAAFDLMPGLTLHAQYETAIKDFLHD